MIDGFEIVCQLLVVPFHHLYIEYSFSRTCGFTHFVGNSDLDYRYDHHFVEKSCAVSMSRSTKVKRNQGINLMATAHDRIK